MDQLPKKKILILVNNFSYKGGGIPHSVINMAKYMSGYIIFDLKTKFEFYADIAINEFSSSKEKYNIYDYDALLIAGSWQLNIFMDIFKTKYNNKKIFYMPKGNLSLFEFLNLKSIYKIPYLVFFESLKIFLSSSVIFTSQKEKSSSIINFISKDKHIFHDYFGKINMNEIIFKKSRINLGFIASYNKRKSLIECLMALHYLLKNHSHHYDFILNIAGSSNDVQYQYKVEKVINDLKLKNYINFHGDLDSKEKQKFYKNNQIILIPSKFESYSLVGIEAFHYGSIPLISDNVGMFESISSTFFNLNSIDPEYISLMILKIIDKKNHQSVNDERIKVIKNLNSLISASNKDFRNFLYDV